MKGQRWLVVSRQRRRFGIWEEKCGSPRVSDPRGGHFLVINPSPGSGPPSPPPNGFVAQFVAGDDKVENETHSEYDREDRN